MTKSDHVAVSFVKNEPFRLGQIPPPVQRDGLRGVFEMAGTQFVNLDLSQAVVVFDGVSHLIP